MRTAFVANVPRKTTLWDVNAPLTVAIGADSAPLRARIETLTRRSGALISAESDRYDVLLVSQDDSTPLPSSTEALSLLTPAGANVCLIWTGKAPPRGTISRLLRAGVAGVVPNGLTPQHVRTALHRNHAGLLRTAAAYAAVKACA